jgi:hypothetical protein
MSNDKKDVPIPIAVPGPHVLPPSPMTSIMHSPTLPPIQLHKLPTSVKAQYDAYQAGMILHYTLLEDKFLWKDGTFYKYYENDQVTF